MPIPVLVGSAEAAKMLDIGPTNFSHLRKKMVDANDPNFPEPIQRLQCGPIWLEKDMLKFKKHYDSRRRRVRSDNGDAPVAETPAPETKPKATRTKATPKTNGKATASVTDITKPTKRIRLKTTG